MATEIKIPKTLGACADRLYKLRESRLKITREAAKIEAEEKAIKEYIINELPKSEASGVSGRVANVKVTKKQVAQVADWPAFYKHVKRTGDFDLLGRALKQEAVRERWDAKKKVPGVVAFDALSVSCTKI